MRASALFVSVGLSFGEQTLDRVELGLWRGDRLDRLPVAHHRQDRLLDDLAASRRVALGELDESLVGRLADLDVEADAPILASRSRDAVGRAWVP